MLCFECGWEAVGGKNALNMHFQRKHKEMSLNCSKCTKICTSAAALGDHMRQVHGERKPCEYCTKEKFDLGHEKHKKLNNVEKDYTRR